MKQKLRLFSESLTLALRLAREQIGPLALLLALGTLITINAENLMQTAPSAEENSRWILQVCMGLWELCEGLAMILILSWGIPKLRPLTEAHFTQHPFAENYLGSFFAEYLRLLANVLLWGLLLIIPGFVRYCRLIFVPYVAIFARPYREGKIDALELAADLTRGRFAWLIGIMLLFTGVQVGIEFVPHLLPELHILPLRILFIGISFFISVWLFALLYLLFEQAMEEYEWT